MFLGRIWISKSKCRVSRYHVSVQWQIVPDCFPLRQWRGRFHLMCWQYLVLTYLIELSLCLSMAAIYSRRLSMYCSVYEGLTLKYNDEPLSSRARLFRPWPMRLSRLRNFLLHLCHSPNIGSCSRFVSSRVLLWHVCMHWLQIFYIIMYTKWHGYLLRLRISCIEEWGIPSFTGPPPYPIGRCLNLYIWD